MELADQHAAEAEGAVSGAEIPDRGASESGPVEVAPNSGSDKPLSLRDQLIKNLETAKARDGAGRFTKDAAAALSAAQKPAEGEPKGDPAPAAAATDSQKPDQNAQPDGSNQSGPPSAWKGIWESMTPEARAIAVKREGEVEKGFEEYRNKTAQFQEISQALDPVRAVLQQSGIQSDAQAVKQLVQWENAFRNPQTRMQAFQNLAQTYGIDLSSMARNPSEAPSPAQDGSQVPQPDYRAEISSLVQQQVAAISTEQTLNNFAKDHTHFHKVSRLMGAIMQAGNAADLESAYNQAIEIHPEVSATLKAERAAKATEEKAKAEADAKAAAAEKARKAQAAAVSPSGRPPAIAPVNGKATGNSVRESILKAVKERQEDARA